LKHIKSPADLGDQQGYICPDHYVAEMTVHWVSLGNTPSPSLKEMWRTMAMTFNERIAAPSADATWRVLQPPTGTGKTQGLCVYAALAARKNVTVERPVGILIVTRTIKQADEIVFTIGQLTGPQAALRVAAKHSKNKITVAEMRGTDILVITHEAYTRAL
jgi:Rad3-related DNA helicase